jgi:hypothetical protein
VEVLRTSISITREIARPLNESLSFVVARRNREQSDRAHDAGVAELRLSGDDRVGYVVVNCLSNIFISMSLSPFRFTFSFNQVPSISLSIPGKGQLSDRRGSAGGRGGKR